MAADSKKVHFATIQSNVLKMMYLLECINNTSDKQLKQKWVALLIEYIKENKTYINRGIHIRGSLKVDEGIWSVNPNKDGINLQTTLLHFALLQNAPIEVFQALHAAGANIAPEKVASITIPAKLETSVNDKDATIELAISKGRIDVLELFEVKLNAAQQQRSANVQERIGNLSSGHLESKPLLVGNPQKDKALPLPKKTNCVTNFFRRNGPEQVFYCQGTGPNQKFGR